MSLSVFHYVFALFSVAVTVSTHLCVICHHFCSPTSLFQGHVICWTFYPNWGSIIQNSTEKGVSLSSQVTPDSEHYYYCMIEVSQNFKAVKSHWQIHNEKLKIYKCNLLVKIDIISLFVSCDQLVDNFWHCHHHQFSSRCTWVHWRKIMRKKKKN